MSYIRKKILHGKQYAYEISSHWDPVLKQSRSKSKYLGPIDQKTGEIIQIPRQQAQRMIIDFGDGYFLNEFITKSDFYSVLKKTLFEYCPGLMPLIIYRLCMQSAMHNCENWLEGNITRFLFKDIDLSSQRISEIIGFLADESIQYEFFKAYNQQLGGSEKSVIIDATSLPNQCHHDFNAWGRSDGKIEKQFRLLCVVDQAKKLPLFYRFLPGNLPDVSALETTILELETNHIRSNFVLLDAGFFSKTNIHALYTRKIDFLIRLPAGRCIYKQLLLTKMGNIESLKHAQIFGTRTIFVKRIKIDLYTHKAYAYLVLDPERKAKEIKDLAFDYCADKSERDENKDKLALASCGIMVLVSSKLLPAEEVLASYYMRQSVEQIFGFSKHDLGLLPIRNHTDRTIQGYLFLQFLLLILFIQIREKIDKLCTVEQALMTLRKLKCKIYDDKIIPLEPTAKQKSILERFQILAPKKLGI